MLFALAAAIGAVLRHALGRLLPSWRALLIANTAGSAALGWLVEADVSRSTVLVVGSGLCGALTTFSSFALRVRELGPRRGTAYVVATMVCACGAAAIASSC
ncbi:fluoride efflux transporter FluC [Ilumatobacter sp.]|uniref:fluoride efflux transporter FluC n=1 Tax=Ilumatobacter sp. TaxID=1967498 RepID=UPI003B51667C